MTREEARKAAEVMLAYANGEEIEIAYSNSSYQTVTSPEFDWGKVEYRVKTKPTYRPFKDKEECWNEMLKHEPFGWLIDKDGDYLLPSTAGDDTDFICRFRVLKFADGTPFGIKEE